MGSVVRAVVQPFLAAHGGNGLVDEVIVLDDGSLDDTAEQARDAGARVVAGPGGAGGKGQAMAAALAASTGDIVAFLDADVANTTPAFVTGLLGPLLTTDDVALVKGFYTRPLHGDPTGGGRVTELVARPVLELLFPELSWVRQPLAGETAAHRWVFEKLGFAPGYGVELGLLIDVAQSLGAERAGPGRPRRAHPPQPAAGRAAPPGRRRAAGRARAGPAVLAAAGVEQRTAHAWATAVSATIVVSNRGPLAFRGAPDGSLVPVPAGRRPGLVAAPAPRRERHDVGLGDDGGGGPRGGRPGAHGRGRARPRPRRRGRRHLPPGLRRGRQHDAVVLPPPPLRPAAPAPVRPVLAGGLGGLPDLQPGHGRRGGGAGRRRAPPCSCRTTTSRCWGGCWPSAGPTCARCTSSTRRSPRPPCSACCPTPCAAELLDGMAGYSGLRLPLPQVGGRLHRLLRRGRPRRRRATFVAPLGPDAGVLEEEAASPASARRPRRRCAPRWAGAASSPGRTAWSRRRTSCGGCWPSRSC